MCATVRQPGISRGTIPNAPRQDASANGPSAFAALLAWFDSLDALGFDGRDLTEVGLKNGSLVVDDSRSGKRWAFNNINFSLTRPREGGVAFAITSSGADGPWSLAATVAPRGEGRRGIEALIRDVSPKDVLLALRIEDDALEADMPISGIIKAEIAADGTVLMAQGQIVAGAGFIGVGHAPASRMLVDEARAEMRWDAANRVLLMPVQVHSGANQIRPVAHVQPPRQPGDPWELAANNGSVSLGGAERTPEPPLVPDRINVRARTDTSRRSSEVKPCNLAAWPAATISAIVDYAEAEPRLSMGVVARRMTILTMKRLWPAFIVPPLRAWVIDHFPSGTVENFSIAASAPWNTLKPGGPPVPDGGLSGEIAGTVTLRPVDTLPAIRDADLVAKFTGRTATVTLGRGTVDLPSGRKVTVSNGTFEVPDTAVKGPPSRLRLRLDGPADAAIELAGMEPLRGAAAVQLDAATTRGAVSARLDLSMPLKEERLRTINYNLEADVTNFSAEKLVRGLKTEARSCASRQIRSRFRGQWRCPQAMLVVVDYRKKPAQDAEVRASTVLDDAARTYLGFDLGGGLTGPIPIKFSGKIAAGDGDNRFAVDADLTQAKVADLLPGWTKAAGKPARATFILYERAQSRRIEDLLLEGSGTRVKGTIDLDAAGELVTANFPNFALSDGDKASAKAERGSDGTLKVTVRGDVYDGRGFIKSMATGPADPNTPRPQYDLDLDLKVGAVAGFHGEALRGLEVRLSRRAGQIRTLAMNAKIGVDAPLTADLRGRAGRHLARIERGDAGALFRFTDIYPRIVGGRMTVAMEPPTGDQTPKEGRLDISEFVVRGEAALDRVASSAPPPDGSAYRAAPPRSQGVEFTRMRIDFTRSPGRLSIREGNVLGMAVCATMDGQIDFLREDTRLRGTFIPACALNNLPGQFPILGMFFGGPKEGLLGVTYEVVGPPGGMVLRVNPMSAMAPGFLRKLFEFRGADDFVTGETGRSP